jgi:hypothetical protein
MNMTNSMSSAEHGKDSSNHVWRVLIVDDSKVIRDRLVFITNSFSLIY